MTNYQPLVLPITDIFLAVAKFECPTTRRVSKMIPVENLGEEFIALLRAESIRVFNVESFYLPAYDRMAPHIDGRPDQTLSKINFSYGSPGSTVTWSRLTDPTKERLIVSNTGLTYRILDADYCVPVERIPTIISPVLINVSNPHSVENQYPEDTWILSCSLMDPVIRSHMSFETARERLSKYWAPLVSSLI